ncbi:fatty acid desaturase family protein [Sphingomonas sp. MMS12-HWE2-04]|uniref:fatty acid desaturase family protein n=1 Tax=Sphingomonas sp. MMS12-HWE2-04 TaxID=3234199 RepID=UPI0038507799
MTRSARHARRQPEIQWRDLVSMRVRDGLAECCNPLPWLGLSLGCAAFALWVPATIASFLFFLTALRLNHEAIHGNLGFRPRGDRIVLHALSALMLGSNSAVAFNHLRHHQHLGTDGDLEGAAGRMRLGQVLLFGPVFPIAMHRAAWRDGSPALRRRMRIDAALNLMTIGVALASGIGFLRYHLAAMLVAQCLTAFFAVWTTHHDCEDQIARTQRAPLLNWMTYNMFLHLEHHLFPGVPVRRLGIVAVRLRAVQAGNAKLVVPEPRMVAWRRA